LLDLSFPGVEFPGAAEVEPPVAPVFPLFVEPVSAPDLSLPVAEDPD